MSNTSVGKKVDELCDAAMAAAKMNGVSVAEKAIDGCQITMSWISYLQQKEDDGEAVSLLKAMRSAAIEVMACLCLGFVRPAIASMRVQIDLALAWLYYRDHLVEWRSCQDPNGQMKLHSELLKYLRDNFPGFEKRVEILAKCSIRRHKDPYGLLSIHVHGARERALPDSNDLKDAVAGKSLVEEASQLFVDVNEFISDLYLAYFASDWIGLPKVIQENAKERLNAADMAKVFT